MKNLQNILKKPDLREEIEGIKRSIRGKSPKKEVDIGVENFFKDLVLSMENKEWGIFLGRNEQWIHDLQHENEEFFNQENKEEEIKNLEKIINEYRALEEENPIEIKYACMYLAAKIMLEARLSIHKLSRSESSSPGIGISPVEASSLDFS